jgi:archaellum component FlaF (FlaF/FlaG flagellin family)
MGISTVVTHVILFIAVLSIASGLLVVIKNYADQTEGTFITKANEYDKVIRTSIKIDVLSYNNVTKATTIYIRNTGQSDMQPSQIDVYIDGVRFPRNDLNRTILVTPDTDINDAGIWNPKEELEIEAFQELSPGITHNIIVTTPYNVRDTETISI